MELNLRQNGQFCESANWAQSFLPTILKWPNIGQLIDLTHIITLSLQIDTPELFIVICLYPQLTGDAKASHRCIFIMLNLSAASPTAVIGQGEMSAAVVRRVLLPFIDLTASKHAQYEQHVAPAVAERSSVFMPSAEVLFPVQLL